MPYTTLKTYKPLQAKTTLKAKTPLKRSMQQSSKKFQRKLSSNGSTSRTTLKVRQKTAKKLKAAYFSIFSESMSVCAITGASSGVVPHHIFDGPRKTFSETYGFMLPLRCDWHTGENYSIHSDRKLSLYYMYRCEDYWINTLHRTKEEWISEAGKWWDKESA